MPGGGQAARYQRRTRGPPWAADASGMHRGATVRDLTRNHEPRAKTATGNNDKEQPDRLHSLQGVAMAIVSARGGRGRGRIRNPLGLGIHGLSSGGDQA